MEKLLTYLNQERGRRGKLAESLGVSPSAISMWTRVPGERLMDVSRATGIRPEELRPDMFAPEPQKGAA
jgi:DNA-binding transcriptional regulator YdaS (Cro superfamily)